MDETDFKDTFKETLQFINQNLKRKGGFMNSSNVNDGCIKGKLRKEKQWYIVKVNLDQVFISKETVDLSMDDYPKKLRRRNILGSKSLAKT